MKLQDMGYGSFFDETRKELGADTALLARVVSEHRLSYVVRNEKDSFTAKVSGAQMFKAVTREDYPAVGDWVVIEELGDGKAVIQAILPRRSVLKRRYGRKDKSGANNAVQVIASNIDHAFIVESVDRDYNLNRFERYITVSHLGNVHPVIVLNKVDLLTEEELQEMEHAIKRRFPEIDMITTSTTMADGTEALERYITNGKTYCFLGSSGVGKSSLINALLQSNEIATGDISHYSKRGKHTTTHRNMYFLKNGGIVIDNPGVREIGVAEESVAFVPELEKIIHKGAQCAFRDCSHTHEPGCVVRGALETGSLGEDEYENFLTLRKEAQHFEMSALEKRNKERRFSKHLKNSKKLFKELDEL